MQPCRGRAGGDSSGCLLDRGAPDSWCCRPPRFTPSWLHHLWGQRDRDRVGALPGLQQPQAQDGGGKCSLSS